MDTRVILDATAGNRTMWQTAYDKDTIYIDIEKRLAVKPDIFADNTNTPFLSESFDTIFYDPPHGWGEGHPFYKYPDSESYKKKWQGYGEIPRYYGWDKFKNQQELLVHLWRAQKEFHRIIKDDGLLWLKWNETCISLNRVLRLFENWFIMLILSIKSPTQTAGTKKTFWVCLKKEKVKIVKTTLL
jgi:hypothetical protein